MLECPPMPLEIAQDAPEDAQVAKEPRKLTQAEKEQLAKDHAPIVYHYAEKFAKAFELPTVDIDEVAAFGWRGLAHALERYEPGKDGGTTFGGYCRSWVRGAIIRGLKREDRQKFWLHQSKEAPGIIDGDSEFDLIPAPLETNETETPKAVICLMVDVSASMEKTRVQSIRKLLASQVVDKIATFSGDDAEWLWDREDDRKLLRAAM